MALGRTFLQNPHAGDRGRRQPIGVVAAITPFNFPGMIPLWFLPYAVATGNCFILKPSEKTPATAQRLVELLQQTELPNGVVQLIHGQTEASKALIRHPQVRAISFVGSTAVAQSHRPVSVCLAHTAGFSH